MRATAPEWQWRFVEPQSETAGVFYYIFGKINISKKALLDAEGNEFFSCI